MLLNEFNKQLNDLLLDFLWKQWIQLGIHASVSPKKRDGWIIDPEALWLLTASIGREDARLFDLAMDWLTANASFINISRLKSLLRQHEFESGPVVAAMAATIQQQNKRLKWNFPQTGNPDAPALLFKREGTEYSELQTTAVDPVFQQFGYIRGPVQIRNLARRFNYTMPECALLRLRALTGLNARAEIYAYLCTHANGHPSGIAREAGYSQKNIQDTITDMSAAHIVISAQMIGRKKIYLIHKDDRKSLLYNTEDPPRWITWLPLFRALEILWTRGRELGQENSSPLFLSGKLRELTDQLRPLLEREENTIILRSYETIQGADYTPIFLEDMLNLLSSLLNPHS